MSAADAAPPPAGSSPGPGDGGSSDKGEDTDVDAVTGLPVSFSGIFNTQVTDTNVPTVLSKLQKWGDYESYGEPVGPSRFIPMKTPLSPTLLADFGVGNGDRADDPSDANGSRTARVHDEESNASRKKNVPHVHTLPAFLEAQKKKGRDVGLVIDLSNHDCLYTDGIPDTGVKRVHVRNVAKSVPGLDSVKEAIAAASKFWDENDENQKKYVAIHCAYGFNRTGFVLCCYLVEKCGMTAEEALEAFAVARKPGVKHERFREALRRRYPSDDADRDVEETLLATSSLPGDGAADASGNAPAPFANLPELGRGRTTRKRHTPGIRQQRDARPGHRRCGRGNRNGGRRGVDRESSFIIVSYLVSRRFRFRAFVRCHHTFDELAGFARDDFPTSAMTVCPCLFSLSRRAPFRGARQGGRHSPTGDRAARTPPTLAGGPKRRSARQTPRRVSRAETKPHMVRPAWTALRTPRRPRGGPSDDEPAREISRLRSHARVRARHRSNPKRLPSPR